MRIAFSPRKNSLVLYILDEEHTSIDKLNKLGKHKRGKSCLYINKLADVDVDVLKELIKDSLDYIDAKYGSE